MSIFTFLVVPFVYAQEIAQEAGPTTFAGSYTLWIAIVIGLVASILTFRYAIQMKGSTVGQILNLFGFGMFVVVLGFLSVVVAWGEAPAQENIYYPFFFFGFIWNR